MTKRIVSKLAIDAAHGVRNERRGGPGGASRAADRVLLTKHRRKQSGNSLRARKLSPRERRLGFCSFTKSVSDHRMFVGAMSACVRERTRFARQPLGLRCKRCLFAGGALAPLRAFGLSACVALKCDRACCVLLGNNGRFSRGVRLPERAQHTREDCARNGDARRDAHAVATHKLPEAIRRAVGAGGDGLIGQIPRKIVTKIRDASVALFWRDF